jgi:hypothetical protein
LLKVISFTPFLEDLTDAGSASKESLQSDHTDYAARLHSAVPCERIRDASPARKRQGARPKVRDGKIEPGDQARFEVEG